MLLDRKEHSWIQVVMFFSHVAEMQGTCELMHNSNWVSGEKFGLKSYACFKNQTSSQREFDLKSQVSPQTKIARHEVQLPLDYIFSKSQKIQSPRYR